MPALGGQPQWNANYIPPPSSNDGANEAAAANASGGVGSPEELLRRLSLTAQTVSNSHTSPLKEFNPRTAFPDLHLSGNVISATFCVPYRIQYGSDGEWDLKSRTGTSAMFDSFSYLASEESPWKHTLVGWTGEIERKPDGKGDDEKLDTAAKLHSAAGPSPFNQSAKYAQPNQPDLRIPSRHRRSLEIKLNQDHGGCVEPVWLPDHRTEDGTMIFRNQKKWRRYGEHELFTLFHYKQNEPSDGRETKTSYQDYETMNEAFADAIFAVYKPGDIVLIHDYQLFLLPRLLHKRIPAMYIGFFLHIPFPSYEFYRCLTRRSEILEGVLGANLIGFQSFGYSRHFASCCNRILYTDSSSAGVDFDGVHSSIDVFPIGINATTTLQSAFGSPGVEEMTKYISELHKDKKIIIGRDRMDSVRGVVQKLQAFEVFLERHPEWRAKVVLIQVTSPTSIEDRDEKGDRTEVKIAELVSRINGTYGDLGYMPVRHYETYISKEEYLALLRVADLGLITSVRDGMNTTALEYILCQRDHHNPLIISEFSGTAGSLKDAIHINPWDLSGVADAIDRALKMPDDEKLASHQKLYKQVKNNTIQAWTNSYLKRLLTNLTAFNKNKTTPVLDEDALVKRYRQSTRRLFMFDYDGTLTPIVKDPDAAIPSDRVIRTLKALATNPNNTVWIISGRDQNFLDEWMGHISALGLSAEHGSFMRNPESSEWKNLTLTFDMSWQDKVMEVFNRWCERTIGANIERKKIALVFHYRKADPVLGPYNAGKCQREVERLVAGKWDVDVMTGKANVEVRPSFVNKGSIAKSLVNDYAKEHGGDPDFVLCLGDDTTDEDMFRALRASTLDPSHVFAVTIGSPGKQTLASWHLAEPKNVISALALLNESADAADDDVPEAATQAAQREGAVKKA